MTANIRPTENPAVRFIIRTVACLLLFATCMRVWFGPLPVLPAAYGQIPDAGMQRKLLLEEAIRTNQLLTEIRSILADRALNVRIQGADNSSATGLPRG